jgi:hypothetical protein
LTLPAVAPGTTVAALTRSARERLAARGLSEQGAVVVVGLDTDQHSQRVDARVLAHRCLHPTGAPGKPSSSLQEVAPTERPAQDARPEPSPPVHAPALPRPGNGAAPAERPSRAEGVTRKAGADLLGPDIARIIANAQHVELFRVALPQDDRTTDLSRYNVVSAGRALTADEIQRMRHLLLHDPGSYLPDSLVQTCPALPELMLEARHESSPHTFETVRIVISLECATARFILNADPGRTRGLFYYEPAKQDLRGLLTAVLARTPSSPNGSNSPRPGNGNGRN